MSKAIFTCQARKNEANYCLLSHFQLQYRPKSRLNLAKSAVVGCEELGKRGSGSVVTQKEQVKMAKKRNRKKPQMQDNYLKKCNSDIKEVNWDGKKAKEQLENEQLVKNNYVIPLYPFRFDNFWVYVWEREGQKIDLNDEVYDFSESDLDTICKTLGFTQLFDLPYVKAFLRNNCSVQNLNDCSWPDIVGGLKFYLQKQSSTESKEPTVEAEQKTKPAKESKSKSLAKESQSARTAALLSAATQLKQIADNFENWAKKEHARFVDPNGVKPPAFTLAQIEDWVNTYLLKQRLVAVFFRHPHLSYDKNSGLTPFLTAYERKEFNLIIDVFRLYMPAIATSLKELYDEFWGNVEHHIKCHERSKKVQQENIPSIGENIENTFWHPPLFLDGAVATLVRRLRHIAKMVEEELTQREPAETEQKDVELKTVHKALIKALSEILKAGSITEITRDALVRKTKYAVGSGNVNQAYIDLKELCVITQDGQDFTPNFQHYKQNPPD